MPIVIWEQHLCHVYEQREQADGRLSDWQHRCNIRIKQRLRQRYIDTNITNNRQGRLRFTTPQRDPFILYQHLQNRLA